MLKLCFQNTKEKLFGAQIGNNDDDRSHHICMTHSNEAVAIPIAQEAQHIA